MPRFDGTGPRGQGSGTGQGRVWCSNIAGLGRKYGKRTGLAVFGIALARYAIQDIQNPQGIIRSLLQRVTTALTQPKGKQNTDGSNRLSKNISEIEERR